MTKKQQSLFAISSIFVILLIDQLVKIWIKTNFSPYQTETLIPGFLELHFIENRGMAFGTEFGAGIWAKYALSTFRLLAIIGIGYYLRKIILHQNSSFLFLLSIVLIFAGATGNLIDGMFYDYAFDLDTNFLTNWSRTFDENNGVFLPDQIRETGFMLGSVVDMFRFTVTWPSWMPFGLGGEEIFPPIWNVADFSISCGVGLLLLRYRKNFGNEKHTASSKASTSL
ncbi:MAG: signal peptidase II [Putridiphycobacter sp.]|nr:signal peptidase II [Putridiphycobacter sp.]